jgi:hypothetical protein
MKESPNQKHALKRLRALLGGPRIDSYVRDVGWGVGWVCTPVFGDWISEKIAFLFYLFFSLSLVSFVLSVYWYY